MAIEPLPDPVRLDVPWERRKLPDGTSQTVQVRSSNLWWKYRVTLEQYDAVREAQGGRCAICARPESELRADRRGRPRKDGEPTALSALLHVDHDHSCCPTSAKSCGACNRELLCSDCNVAIGYLADDPVRALRMVEYLQRWAAYRESLSVSGKP